LRRLEIVDASGRIGNHALVRTMNGRREFVLVPGAEESNRPAVVITQKDIREVQLAKAAIAAGWKILLQDRGISPQDLDQVVIAGAFGSYIDIPGAVALGLLPDLPLARFRQVGNAAGQGAKLALTSLDKRYEAQALAHRVRYMELARAADFQEIFIRSLALG